MDWRQWGKQQKPWWNVIDSDWIVCMFYFHSFILISEPFFFSISSVPSPSDMHFVFFPELNWLQHRTPQSIFGAFFWLSEQNRSIESQTSKAESTESHHFSYLKYIEILFLYISIYFIREKILSFQCDIPRNFPNPIAFTAQAVPPQGWCRSWAPWLQRWPAMWWPQSPRRGKIPWFPWLGSGCLGDIQPASTNHIILEKRFGTMFGTNNIS